MTDHVTSRYQGLNSSELGAKIENLGTRLPLSLSYTSTRAISAEALGTRLYVYKLIEASYSGKTRRCLRTLRTRVKEHGRNKDSEIYKHLCCKHFLYYKTILNFFMIITTLLHEPRIFNNCNIYIRQIQTRALIYISALIQTLVIVTRSI